MKRENISKPEDLKILYLDSNQLTSLPSEISELKNLEKLYLYNNELTSLPSEIGELKNLKILDLWNNPLDFQNYETIEVCGKKIPVSHSSCCLCGDNIKQNRVYEDFKILLQEKFNLTTSFHYSNKGKSGLVLKSKELEKLIKLLEE